MALIKNMVNSTEFLSGGGEIGALIRTLNWSQTPVGSPETWPASLKNTIRLILDNGSPMYVVWGSEYIQFYNDAFNSVLGKDSRPVAMGMGARGTFTEAWKTLEPIFEEVLSGKTVFFKDRLLPLFRNGSLEECYFNLSFSPIRDDSGYLAGVMAIFHDVTEQVLTRKKMEESEKRYRSQADTIPHMMWTSTPDGVVNYANRFCLEYSGMVSQKKYSDGWIQAIHPYDLPSVSRAWISSVRTGKPFKEEYRIRRVDGEYRWFLGRALPIKNNSDVILYWNGTATDIEDYKRIERELEAAKENAENANATKTAFLANMSHEIRTPLGAILGFSELLKSANLEHVLRDQYIETISRNGQNLTRIIDDILDIAKVEAGRLDVEHIDFALFDLLTEVINLLSGKAKQKGIYLTLSINKNVPKNIYSDPTRLRQIFINIIGNAIKFTDMGGVAVHVKSKQHMDGTLKLSVEVTDTGRGLTEEQKNRLFEPFTQADNTTTRQFGGTGLGLALSKRLSEALGGTITIDKYEEDRGCTFIVSFVAMLGKEELMKVDSASDCFCPSKNLPLKGMHVLFADDSPDNQFLIEHFLTINGAEVSLASDGSEAVDKALAGKFDLVLMDIQMPKMDGYQATKVLLKRGYKTPIVALTAHAMAEERTRTKAVGFSGHLTKPLNFTELLQTIVSHAITN
ncbi:MAG: ATP-binding protein [Bacteriovorax sp.]|nr:ATP-binding protein [Bacteriovorax sp.]